MQPEIVLIASRALIERNKDLIAAFNAKAFELNHIIFHDLDLLSIKDFLLDSKGPPALLFSSQNAILSLHLSLQKNPAYDFLRQIPSLVIAPSSAEFAKSLGFCVEFIGNSAHSEGFLDEIAPRVRGRKVLYFRAREIVSDWGDRLRDRGICIKQIVSYHSQIRDPKDFEKIKIGRDSVVIFGAPSHFRAFVQIFGWDDSLRAVAIGHSTFRAFDKGIQGCIAKEKSLLSCFELASSLLLQKDS